MSQQLVTSPEVIYDTLTNDTTFMSYVGEYTFADGSTLDAISILTPGSAISGLQQISGLEVVIHDTGTINNLKYISEPTDGLVTWRVYLMMWPPANGSNLTASVKRIMALFSNADANDVSVAPNGTGTSLGALDQMAVTIPELSVVMT